MSQQDLNDLYYYVQVVDQGGFASAGRALGLPKSKLSRRIDMLEQRLGVRLIHRSTRRFTVTDIGQQYYERCRAMLLEAEAAQEVIDQTRAEPCGRIRVSCPVALLHARVGTMLADFMAAYPRVQLEVDATNRRVDVISEGVDVALRVRPPPLEDADLVLKVLGEHRQCLVASPTLIGSVGKIQNPADLSGIPSLDVGPSRPDHAWHLQGPEGAEAKIRHHPRLVTDDMLTLRAGAIAGAGIVQMPAILVRDELRSGVLLPLLPAWGPKRYLVHAVYPSKRGLLPSVRALLDHLGQRFEQLKDE